MNNDNRLFALNAIACASVPGSAPAVPEGIDYYGEDVFSISVMREFMPADSAGKLAATIENGKPLDPEIADDVANAMKEWASSADNGDVSNLRVLYGSVVRTSVRVESCKLAGVIGKVLTLVTAHDTPPAVINGDHLLAVDGNEEVVHRYVVDVGVV